MPTVNNKGKTMAKEPTKTVAFRVTEYQLAVLNYSVKALNKKNLSALLQEMVEEEVMLRETGYEADRKKAEAAAKRAAKKAEPTNG